MRIPKFNMAAVKSAASVAAFTLKKHAPKIMFLGGLAAGGACVVTACKQTLKLDEEIQDTLDDIQAARDAFNDPENEDERLYAKADYSRDILKLYGQAGIKVAKLYAVPTILGVASVGLLCGSHTVMAKRNAAISAAFAGLSADFEKYRARVRENLGAEVDKQLRFGEKMDVIELPPEGKGKKPKKEAVKYVEQDLSSPYIFFFDPRSREWEPNPEYNKMFLVQLQNKFNQQLKARKHVFLNEILRELDIPETQAGQVCGWIYDPECPNGDLFIDFGIFDTKRQANRDFVNGYEDVIMLDFNCQGNIVSLL